MKEILGRAARGGGSPMISVIIPVWNDAGCLAALLERLREEPGPVEIIVADGGSRDNTAEVVRQYPEVMLRHSTRGRGAQMNEGARSARGEILVFLHCDTTPPRGALAILPELLKAEGGDFGAFQVSFDPPFRLIQMLAWFTRFARPWCCYGDQGIFARREFFKETGGFPEIPLLEDVHWLRLAARRGKMIRSRCKVVTSARRFQRAGILSQTLRNLMILIRDRLGEDPHKLAEIYQRGYAGSRDEVGTIRERESVVEPSVGAERG